MAISDDDLFLLNRMNSTAQKVQLGTLVRDAEQGGLADNAVTTAKIAADAVTNAKIADTAVSVEHLDSGIAPSHIVKYAGSFTTVGGDADESISVSGVTGTDIVVVTVKTAGVTPRSVVAAAAGTNAIAVTMSGDPSTDHVLHYIVWRAAS